MNQENSEFNVQIISHRLSTFSIFHLKTLKYNDLFSKIQFLSIAKKLLNIHKENWFAQQKLSLSKTSFGQADGLGIT